MIFKKFVFKKINTIKTLLRIFGYNMLDRK